MKRLDSVLVILILLLSVFYYSVNTNKVTYTWDVLQQGFEYSNEPSSIVRIELKGDGMKGFPHERQSFIKDVITDEQERNIILMQISENIEFDRILSGEIFIEVNDERVEAIPNAENVVVIDKEDMIIYIINRDYKYTMVKLLESDN